MPEPSTRARDSDRDRIVAVLDDAFVDGQLSDADRDLRVSQALAARTIADLDALVRDLQDAAPGLSSGPPRRTIATIAAAASVTVLIAIVGVISMAGDDDPEKARAVAEAVEIQQPSSEPTVEQTEESQLETTAKPLTRQYFEDFRNAYRKRFGGTRIYAASFYEAGYVVFKRPHARASKDLLQDWDWYPGEGFQRSSVDASANAFGSAPFDLASVNFKALARHVEQGRRYLGVTNPEMGVSMDPTSGDPAQVIEVRASNSHGDYGRRNVAPDGQLTASYPFVVGDQ